MYPQPTLTLSINAYIQFTFIVNLILTKFIYTRFSFLSTPIYKLNFEKNKLK